LRLTPICGPSGLIADGSDVALFDVEAVDANGARCPTFQKRVDFTLDGPAVWRGGYNSGKTNSVNQTFLDLECGINRVSVRSTRDSGGITLRANCPGLKPAASTIKSRPLPVQNGFALELPPMPRAPSTAARVKRILESGNTSAPAVPPALPAVKANFVEAFSYSGPTAKVHVEADAQNGKSIYVDRNFAFENLPAQLRGAEWVQAAQDDHAYSALDLIELGAGKGTSIFVAHDERLTTPVWLQRLFHPTKMTVSVNGRTMRVYERNIDHQESLTLGSEPTGVEVASANMYLVLVKRN
jgi:beta-galactosidase